MRKEEEHRNLYFLYDAHFSGQWILVYVKYDHQLTSEKHQMHRSYLINCSCFLFLLLILFSSSKILLLLHRLLCVQYFCLATGYIFCINNAFLSMWLHFKSGQGWLPKWAVYHMYNFNIKIHLIQEISICDKIRKI